MYCTIPLKNRNCILQSINCTLQQQQGVGGSFRYCTSSLYHLNLSPFYQTLLQAVCRYKVTYCVIKCMFSASIELALLIGLDKFSQLSKGSFNPSGVLLTQFAWIAPAWGTGSDRTKFHWHDKISYQVLFNMFFWLPIHIFRSIGEKNRFLAPFNGKKSLATIKG